jgi:CHRD domain-containing protein
MRTLRLLLPVALVAQVFLAGPAKASPSTFLADMKAEEVQPVPGPPGAKGTARVVADEDARTVCYKINYEGPGQITAAHIHRGERGMTGPVTIALDINAECVNPNPAEIKALVDWPDGYYVELHIAYQQNGAVRGQTVPEGGNPAPAHQQPHQH